ncbi:thymidine kinase, putative [Babesia ovis]|uniref:Thymidine kinase, putative n=1 Tax=Babesia ovis TaxID=5869 RepID=A0A9W5TC54_BABOV|nr:thymidine kinase, putative [Babesia ovis]
MYWLMPLLLSQIALVYSDSDAGKHRKFAATGNGRFTQAALKSGNDDEKGLMSLLFHGPVAPRHISFGIEDSNRGVTSEIQLGEDESHLENTLNRLEESEQNQLDAVQESLYLQNEQLEQIHNFIAP